MSTIPPALAHTVDIPRRTRRNVQQSKGGCFTCRARRKKCDEEKPYCGRCLKAKVVCEGYPYRGSSRHNSFCLTLGTEDQQAIRVPQLCYSPHNTRCTRLYALGLELLFEESLSGSILASSDVWTNMIPQICDVSELVHAAVSSIGATYEATTIASNDLKGPEHHRALHYYKLSLSKLRSAIGTYSGEPTAIFLACILLAAVEVLQGHLESALIHVQGAFALLQGDSSIKPLKLEDSRAELNSNAITMGRLLDSSYEQLHTLARVLDVQIVAFTLEHSPMLAPLPSWPEMSGFHCPPSDSFTEVAATRLMTLIHSCFCFTSVAASYKYVARSQAPPELLMQQCRYIAHLSQWLSLLKQHFNYTSDKSLLVLRAYCLSTLIYLSTVLSPYEKAYDAFDSSFQDITDSVGSILLPQTHRTAIAAPSHRFRLLVSLAQPLFFTAVKCRNKLIRRNAVNLLRLTGREGPWHSRIYAEAAQRIIEIEEKLSNELRTISGKPEASQDAANEIVERARICGCGIESKFQTEACPQSITVSLSRCVDVDEMISSEITAWDDLENWETWSEIVVIKYNLD